MPGPETHAFADTITNRSGQIYNPVLTNLARDYSPDGLVADQLSPEVPIATETFQYNVWEAYHSFATDVDDTTPDRTETREIDISLTQEQATAEEHALKISVSDREQRQGRATGIDPRRAKTRLLERRIALAKEVRVANILRKTTNGGQLNLGAAPSNNWNVDLGTIEDDIRIAKEAVYDAIGIEPNTIVIPYKVANAISIQQDIREIFKYTVDGRELLGAGPNILPPEIWGLRTIIPRSRKVTNALGQTNAFTDVWGDDVRVLYVNPQPDLEDPSVLYTFRIPGTEAVTTWRTPDPPVEWVRNSAGILVEKVVAPDAGYEIQDVLS
jgi:hypothetical protein